MLSKTCVTLAHSLTTGNGIHLCLNGVNNQPNSISKWPKENKNNFSHVTAVQVCMSR